MSDPPKVRVVRCPKCQNLLPELTDFSVYQCGGCGAVLRAKNKNVEADTLSAMPDEERVGEVSKKISEKSENFDFSEKLMRNLSDGFENDVKSNGSSSSSADKEEGLSDTAEKYKNGSMIKGDKWAVENDLEMSGNIDELGHAKMAEEFEDLKLQTGNANGPRRSGHILDWIAGERGEMGQFRGTQRIDVESVGFSASKYSVEGPPNDQLGSNHCYVESANNRNDTDAFNEVEYLEQDRAELLRKLDDLKEQLSGSCDVVDKPKEKVPPDRRVVHQDPYGDSENLFPQRASKYSGEGPSNYQLGSNCDYLEPMKNRNDPGGFRKSEYLEQDRAEILRKLNELEEQLSRSCDLVDKPKETVPQDRRMVHQDSYGGSEYWFPQRGSKYSGEGPSNCQSGSNYAYAEPMKNRNDPDEFNKGEYLEQDRADILKKLNELKEQLCQSSDLPGKPKEKVPLDRRVVHQDPYCSSGNWFPDGSMGLNRASTQYSVPDNRLARPPYISHYSEPPYTSSHEMAMHSFYPSLHTSNQVQGFGDPFRSQMLRRAPHQAPGPYQQQPSHPYFSGHYMDNEAANMDLFEPYQHNINFHHRSCLCFHCNNKHQQVPLPVPPAVKRFSDIPSYHHENLGAFNQRDYNPRFANPPPLNSHNPQSYTRWPSDLNSELGGFVRHRPARAVLAVGGRRCRSIAGGAPFVTCYNCFELLQLPKKVLPSEKSQKKIICAACSKVILLTVAGKKLVISAHAEAKKTLAKVDDSSNVVLNEGSSNTHGHANWASVDFSSDDYDNSGFDFQSMDRKIVSPPTGQDLSSNKTTGMRSSLHSSSSYTSEDGDSPGSSIATRKESNSAELPIKAKPSPPSSGSPLQDHFEYSNKYNVVNRFEKGSRSGRSEPEKVMPKKAMSQKHSIKDAGLATEIEISSNEYSNMATSQDSGDASRVEDQLRVNKGGGSFFAGIIKKSFRDHSRSNQIVEQGRTNVTVNGHPIPERLVKKAEKLAGPVHPGQYWYDTRAGFWGVMGGPCLGIIPPFIEEFNYPMPENCAGGNTGVFVNGRELHQNDLNLLGSRGLPTDRDRSYIIEISGRVLDEDSSEEIDGLGKLAPTIEKVRRGFGMKASRSAASRS